MAAKVALAVITLVATKTVTGCAKIFFCTVFQAGLVIVAVPLR